ncbi:hypothetical protein ACTHGU_13065 [Chitinophagaceae bacterium MMS25-I14]
MRKTGKMLGAIVVLLLFIAIGICHYYLQRQEQQETAARHVKQNMLRASDPVNRRMADSCIGLLHSGDLLLRTGNDVTSYMLSQFNQSDKTYSHCGIVMVENGYPFVYHSIGGEDNPDERMRRDSASFFISAVHNLGFGIARYSFSPQQLGSLQAIVRRYYKSRPLFDMDFDLATNDKLYCAEFIYKSVIEATGDSLFIHPTAILGYKFIGVDNLFVNPHAKTICEVRYK